MAAAALLSALAGCAGSHGTATRQVASVPSTAGAATSGPAGSRSTGAASDPSGPQGPTIPDGASRQEARRLYQPWYQCLTKHGVAHLPNSTLASRDDPRTLKAAEAACQSLQPHPPRQQIPADNPHYKQDLAAWVNCMNAHGGHVHVVPGGWTYDNSSASDLSRKVEFSCEKKAFHEG